jgi:uncharacterized heparinase superfamily protein
VKVYADATGRLLGWWEDAPPEPRYIGVAETLEIDPETNGALVQGVKLYPDAFTLSGGVLTRGGQAVVVNSPSAAYTERQQALVLVQTLKTFNGLDLATLTTAQKFMELWKAQKANNRLTLILGRLLLRELGEE